MHLLESAIARQDAGFAGQLKYPTAVVNAATLGYGLCLNHPFHNGNKRTEPPRICRRLHSLRGWSHEQTFEVFT